MVTQLKIILYTDQPSFLYSDCEEAADVAVNERFMVQQWFIEHRACAHISSDVHSMDAVEPHCLLIKENGVKF